MELSPPTCLPHLWLTSTPSGRQHLCGEIHSNTDSFSAATLWNLYNSVSCQMTIPDVTNRKSFSFNTTVNSATKQKDQGLKNKPQLPQWFPDSLLKNIFRKSRGLSKLNNFSFIFHQLTLWMKTGLKQIQFACPLSPPPHFQCLLSFPLCDLRKTKKGLQSWFSFSVSGRRQKPSSI